MNITSIKYGLNLTITVKNLKEIQEEIQGGQLIMPVSVYYVFTCKHGFMWSVFTLQNFLFFKAQYYFLSPLTRI